MPCWAAIANGALIPLWKFLCQVSTAKGSLEDGRYVDEIIFVEESSHCKNWLVFCPELFTLFGTLNCSLFIKNVVIWILMVTSCEDYGLNNVAAEVSEMADACINSHRQCLQGTKSRSEICTGRLKRS